MNAYLSHQIAQAQGRLVEAMAGAGRFRVGNFSGSGTLRAASAFELAALDREMQAAGFRDGSVMLLSASRDQFSFDPSEAWRRREMIVHAPEQKICTIHSIATDDPYFYVFTLVWRAPRPPA